MATGKKIQVPFEQLIIFSTNLEPLDLADEAFLRRIPYKIEVKNPSITEFARLFEAACRTFGCRFFPEAVHYLIETHYTPFSRPLRRCHPRDLLVADQELLCLLRSPDGIAARLLGSGRAKLFHCDLRAASRRRAEPAPATTTRTRAQSHVERKHLRIVTVNQDIDVNSEPLPGYRLIERIGLGGYGEVWRVEAPGGLTKAIKFVFGKQHEKRATNELRALDHVRGVRHPFLLSLERIEVVDGRLLVVTELADGSVKDRFDMCRRDGLRGIPREELLSYLRDAADALDFMSETHSLQHLDIKPENLLLLAGHVKVADFGLVKDVRQSQASLVGGMTPLYAAPEVFRGTPSRHSDQYSLGDRLPGNVDRHAAVRGQQCGRADAAAPERRAGSVGADDR